MKKLFILIVVSLFAFTSAVYADGEETQKPVIMLTGTPWSVMGTSANGRFICGTRQESMAYRFDTWTRKYDYTWAEGNLSIVAQDVMDDGTVVGTDNDGLLCLWPVDTTAWIPVETTDGKKGEGMAFCCSGDGKYLVGTVELDSTSDKPYNIAPVLWVKQSGGLYEKQYLPVPEKDFLGGVPQWVSPRMVSQDGTRIVGPIVNQTGFCIIPALYYKNADGTWTYDDCLKNIKYGPKFKEILALQPDIDDYVKVKAGESGYIDQVNEYLAAVQEWENKMNAEGYTGHEFTVVPLMSDNGKYLVGEATYNGWYGPAVYDIDNKTYTELTGLTDNHVPGGITNDGDIITYTEDGLMVYLVMHDDYTKPISLVDLLKEYGVDLYSVVPSNAAFIDNSFISGDGQTITARYQTLDTDGNLDVQEMFCVCLKPVVTAIKNVLDTPTSDGIKVIGDKITVDKKAKDISVYSASGRKVKSASATSSLDISSVNSGVYLVVATVNGKKLTTKFVKR